MAEPRSQQDAGMKFLLDECISHAFVQRLAARGYPDSVHPINLGLRTADDHVLVRRALEQDRTIITANADDFRNLLMRQPIHAGLIALPNVQREQSWRLIEVALAYLELRLSPSDFMVNRVLEVSASEGIRPYLLPETDRP